MTSVEAKREKTYTVSERLIFSSIVVVLIVAILAFVLGSSVAPAMVNKGYTTTTIVPNQTASVTTSATTLATTSIPAAPIVVEVTCIPTSSNFECSNSYFNYSTGIYTVAIRQNSGYNWTMVSVNFVPANAVYSHGVPELQWFVSRNVVNVTGGLPTNTVRYINIPITSGPVTVGTNITGSIWAKYELQVVGATSYANMSSAYIVVKN